MAQSLKHICKKTMWGDWHMHVISISGPELMETVVFIDAFN